ncbi:hypothetical protein MRB53_036211 [Persea americana]|uniref:Uncharacterized protein n=1 Tax=Persea americana TaxID=3435 RepID=A0ACC2K6S5_PERAE|nr:hypothetical protein MRB53_036211 [Persea americana]
MASKDSSYQAGQMEGQAKMKKDQLKDQASSTAQSAKESCQQGQENASNFMQQTGEQMKGMAQGATDAVKNTLGMGGK